MIVPLQKFEDIITSPSMWKNHMPWTVTAALKTLSADLRDPPELGPSPPGSQGAAAIALQADQDPKSDQPNPLEAVKVG